MVCMPNVLRRKPNVLRRVPNVLRRNPMFLDASPMFLDACPMFLDASPMFLDAQAYDVSVKTGQATLHKDLPLSGSRPAEQSNCFKRRRIRSDPECARRSQRWPPQLFDHLGQCSQCWWVGWGQKASWLASDSIRWPPFMSWRGYEKWYSGECRQGAPAVAKVLQKI